MPVYLDNAATTRLAPEAFQAMKRVWEAEMGNASSVHAWGVRAATEVEAARLALLDRLGARGGRLVFTSGGTESNNLAIQGLARKAPPKRRRILVSSIEHPSVDEAAAGLEADGFHLDRIPVDGHGVVDLGWLEDRVRDDVLLVSVLLGSHEVGTVQPLRAVGALCRAWGAVFHVDAAQGFTKVPLLVEDDGVDLLSLNGHKLHGPTGVGALWLRDGIAVAPLSRGGGQEGGLRPGTHHTAGIAGFAAAVAAATADEAARTAVIRDHLVTRILAEIPGSRLHAAGVSRLPHIANVGVEGIAGKRLFMELGRRGVLCSTGSACSAGSLAPSRILLAMGYPPERAHEALRLSVCRTTTREEADLAADALVEVVAQERRRN